MASAVGALIGAAYLDGGEAAVEQVVAHLGIDHEDFHAVTYPALPRLLFETLVSHYTNRILVLRVYVADFRIVLNGPLANPRISQPLFSVGSDGLCPRRVGPG